MKNNKKIGILTVHRSLNYGAVWQCWALNMVCKRLGYDVETLDYCPCGYWGYRHYLRKRPSKAVTYIAMQYKFSRFVKKMLNPSAYSQSHDEMISKRQHDDIYIVGSDQVWSTKIVEDTIGSYLLDFAPSTSHRIAYACSLGGVSPNEDFSDVFQRELPKFHAVSVREPQYLDILSKWSGMHVVDVCDPTLLLHRGDFMNYARRKYCLPSKYIAVMDLANEPLLMDVVKSCKKTMKLPVVNLVGISQERTIRNLIGLGPQEWMYVLGNASMVVTDSFHGTALSIVLQRQFICCPKISTMHQEKNIRLTNLLSKTGLTSRCVTALEQLEKIGRIDYDEVQPQIKAYKNMSLEWLTNALNTCE